MKKNIKKINKKFAFYQKCGNLIAQPNGEVAQLARASHWQCEGRGFESLFLHQTSTSRQFTDGFFYVLASRPANKREGLTRRKNDCATGGEVCRTVMK